MKSGEFVSALELYVLDTAVEDTMSTLRSPPGRRVDEGAAHRSRWFNSLSTDDADLVRQVAHDSAHAAVFGLLAVLDGVRVIDDEKGVFELYYTGSKRSLLNPPDVDLHDLLKRGA